MKSLIIGAGEVGQAIHGIIKDQHKTFIRDVEDLKVEGIKVLHICFPEFPKFYFYARKYIKQYKPILTIIHSSVSVGDTEKIGKDVVYSPVRGRHRPSLEKEMMAFPKVVACKDIKKRGMAMEYFKQCGLDVYGTHDVRGTELAKLLSNVHMGLEIAWAQEVARICGDKDCSYGTYKYWEWSYAQGYMKLGQANLMRPIMESHPIGGHCILECTEILRKQYESPAFDFIRGSNEKQILAERGKTC